MYAYYERELHIKCIVIPFIRIQRKNVYGFSRSREFNALDYSSGSVHDETGDDEFSKERVVSR